jgi:hypothetical protein
MDDLSNLSYDDLLKLKAALLVEGFANFNKMKAVILEKGVWTEVNHRKALFYKFGQFTAILSQSVAFDERGRREITEGIQVVLGDFVEWRNVEWVCFLKQLNGDNHPAEHSIFIPGAWLDELLKDYPAIVAKKEQEAQAALDAQKNKLLVEMFSGRVI